MQIIQTQTCYPLKASKHKRVIPYKYILQNNLTSRVISIQNNAMLFFFL